GDRDDRRAPADPGLSGQALVHAAARGRAAHRVHLRLRLRADADPAAIGVFPLHREGQQLFGLLATRGAKLLGMISYSIYLVHCIVLYAVIALVNTCLPIRELG